MNPAWLGLGVIILGIIGLWLGRDRSQQAEEIDQNKKLEENR